MRRISYLWAVALLLSGPTFGQPTARRASLAPLVRVPTAVMPFVDVAALRVEDLAREAQDLPDRFAQSIPVDFTPAGSGLWETVGGEAIWRLRVSSPGALSLNFGFTRYRMPAGGRLWIYSPDFARALGPFTEADNEEHGQLWTPVVWGDDLVIEVTVPAAKKGQLDLALTAVNHDYKGFGRPELKSRIASGSCNVDVVCSTGDPWRREIRAVGNYTLNGSFDCTGSLVNDAARDFKAYFATARHCGANSTATAATVVVYWNFQNSTCRGIPGGGGTGNGQLTQFNSGAFFRASSTTSDFTLLELDDPVLPRAKAFWAGWSNFSGEATSGAAIHHPNNDEKRITLYSTPTTTTSYNNPASPGNGTHVHAVWSLGVTEPGSSGSPLYDQNRRYIGQLHGGPSACGAGDLSDYYGRFSVSWEGGGTVATRAKDWLDPAATGAVTLNGGQRAFTPSDWDGNGISEARLYKNGTWVSYTIP
ncbi:MAG TPA: hypothetical protein VN851_20320 [Thermoanaerobaculia bacterium]|nr:hypothetical protein [Thermoanaerobaculia bacterium]